MTPVLSNPDEFRSSTGRAPYLRKLFAVGGLLALLATNVGGYSDVLGLWFSNAGYSHGFWVVALAIYMAVRAPIFESTRIGYWVPAVLVVGLATGLLAALVYAVETVAILSLVTIPFLLVALLLPENRLLPSLVATAYMLFAVPVWEVLHPLLQTMTSGVVGVMVESTGMTAFVSGNFIHVPDGTFEVAAGCSGVRFFVASMALGSALVILGQYSPGRSVIILIGAAIVGLMANWLRVYSLVAIGFSTKMTHPLVVGGHEPFGWLFFLLPVLWVAFAARRFEPLEATA